MATRSTAALFFESVYGCVSKLVSGICLNVFAKLQGARRVWLTTSNTSWCDRFNCYCELETSVRLDAHRALHATRSGMHALCLKLLGVRSMW